MIGEVHFHIGERELVAFLDEYGNWFCPDDPLTEPLLRLHCSERAVPPSPADGDYGLRWLHKAAELLDGTVVVTPKEDTDPPGTIH
jgi:hypothetical protein